jgi:hypothetical protein
MIVIKKVLEIQRIDFKTRPKVTFFKIEKKWKSRLKSSFWNQELDNTTQKQNKTKKDLKIFSVASKHFYIVCDIVDKN